MVVIMSLSAEQNYMKMFSSKTAIRMVFSEKFSNMILCLGGVGKCFSTKLDANGFYRECVIS